MAPNYNFQEARCEGYVVYFESHYPSAEKYSSLSLSFAVALFNSLEVDTAKFQLHQTAASKFLVT